MPTTRLIELVSVLALCVVTDAVRADYIEVRAKTLAYSKPSKSSSPVSEIEPAVGAKYFALMDEVTTSGYYHIEIPDTGPAWVYRTYVQRHRGTLPTPESERPVPARQRDTEEEGAGRSTGKVAVFKAKCDLPFVAPTTVRGIDKTCKAEGSGASGKQSKENAAQNMAKNNFCATGDPITLAHSDFMSLQQAVDDAGIAYGSHSRLPSDRNALVGLIRVGSRKVGEGSLVRHVGFVNHPRYSNKSKGESVNCNKPGENTNDIHIDIMQTPGDDVCESITVEISPHYRPGMYNPDVLKQFSQRPMRFTGQLFLDGSHKPCVNGKRASPARATIWEIHPAYTIDVCKFDALAKCKAETESSWTPLHVLANEAVDEEDDE